jgi:hypothetical protein
MRRIIIMVVISVLLLCGFACGRPARSGELMDAYRSANCVAPTLAKGVMPDTRGWDTPVEIAGGARATVEGAQMVGGRIILKYEPDGPSVDAAVPGDYIYPSDVRISSKRDRLYVKASGFAAGIRKETWLYEYDLQNRKQMRKELVDPAVLPDECRMAQK